MNTKKPTNQPSQPDAPMTHEEQQLLAEKLLQTVLAGFGTLHSMNKVTEDDAALTVTAAYYFCRAAMGWSEEEGELVMENVWKVVKNSKKNIGKRYAFNPYKH